ncbi:hypothetical protein IWW57_003274 [Coemansia sp. S610]|uniref:DUF202 domain-containing protein n=2 Tax=Coemansia TaxID=4863 RepID=A0A9W8L2Z8_9FUNG|nr:hypothetical protein LPJ60_005273 [Coemansia sp. RSA 2675]KAJ2025749.1 hypothetical protein IWW57_003274 [Coemansia sp. S610]KAJ2371616.1 hypothetical protein H4S02_009491 [Coemansia sp. RSA 2611]KAJ2685694.1 hypothetical protein IWW39_004114 [Coemansia spiralis]
MSTPNETSSSSSSPSMGHTLFSATSLVDKVVGGSASTTRSSSGVEGFGAAPSPLSASLRKSANLDSASLVACDDSAYHDERPPQAWTPEELLEMRARERTFDGAYWRTSVGLFGAALVILRVFGISFFPIGMVFLALGVGFLAIGLTRRRHWITRDTHAQAPLFVTSGGTVLLSGAMCLSAYTVLLVLLWRM